MASADTYIFNNHSYPIVIIKKNNKNTYLRVRDDKIIVTTNYLVSKRKIEELINSNKAFIEKALTKSEKKKDDDSFKLFGHSYDIIYGFNDTSIEENKIFTKDEKTFNKYLSKYIKDVYSGRLNYWNNLFEENIPTANLKIRKMTSRWGVCNLKNKNVTLNLELSKYDMEALDYVIVHELSHFIYPNHSKDFWTLVAKYYPRYKEVRKSLKE